MMIHWIGVQMELLKTMFLISICQFWRQQGRPEGSLFLVKLHHPQDSEGSPRYGIVAGIFFLCNSKLRREILKKRSTHLPSTLAVRLQNSYKGQVWNNYLGYYCYYCIPSTYTFMEFTIMKIKHPKHQ